jgi:molecular chaperone DnaK
MGKGSLRPRVALWRELTMAEIAVGIDLGTSNSCVAIARGGNVEVLPNAYGEHVTASVVAFHENGTITVGNAAKANIIHDPFNTVSSAKRLIGRYFFSEEVKKAQAVYSYGIVEGPAHSLRIQIREEQFSLPEISAMVLREMKSIAEEHLGHEVHKAVITVPAYFNDNQRQATRDAGRIAGLEVLRLLNEPTAAALAYGFGRGLTQRVAVYDLGGGTFDISVLEIGKDVFEVLSTCGDTYLGGDDFDDRLIDLLADEFMAREGINLRNDRFALEKLKVAAEAAKKGLSVEEQVEIRIPDIVVGSDGQARSIERTIARPEYTSLVMDLVQRTFKVCDEALQQANVIARDLGGVILVGGPTRLPVIREAVGEYFQQEPKVDVDPDEVVAMGAAIHAASLVSTDEQDSFLLDVTPLSLRIGVAGGLAETVIERNSPVPIEQTRTFTTYQDFQESVKIRVFQGESRQAEENEMLGQFEFSGFKKARRGDVKIDVTFEINSDGIVNVTACDQETGQQASTQITLSSGLSENEINRIIDEGRTERVRSEAPDGDVALAAANAASPGRNAEEGLGDELDLLPDAGDLLEDVPELEVDEDDGEAVLISEEEEADPNASTQPDQEPPVVTGAADGVADTVLESAASPASEIGSGDVNERVDSGEAIEVPELDGAPDDEIEIQTGAESLFDTAGTDLSQYSDDDKESER